MSDRSYRPKYKDDAKTHKNFNKRKHDTREGLDSLDSISQSNIIRRMIYGDKEYRKYTEEKWGIDFLG